MELSGLYFLFTFGLFFLYLIIITLFGYLILIIVNRNYLYKKLTLKRLLKIFAIGLTLHLIYGTIIISLRIFNFFTIYLPFIFCDIGLMIYIWSKKSNSIKDYFRNFKKRNVMTFFKKNGSYFLIFFVVFLMLYILQMYFINKSLAYPGNDPYLWFNNSWFVHKYGFLDYEVIKSYTPGFVIFTSTMVSFINNYAFFYYFLKFLPIFLSVINIFVLFVLSKDYFKKKFYICFTLIMYLGFTFIFSRNNKPIPSLLATTFGFLFLLFFGKGSSLDLDLKISSVKIFLKSTIKDKKIFLKGLLLAGFSLVHPLYGLLFTGFYFVYEFFLFLKRFKTQSISSNSKLLLVRNFFLSQFLMILIIVLFMSPFVIGTSLSRGIFILDSYLFYFSGTDINLSLFINVTSLGAFFKDLGIWLLFETPYYYIDLFFRTIFGGTHILSFYKETIQVGILLIIIGLFLNFKKSHKLNEKQNTLVNFFKFTFVFTLVILLLTQIFVLYVCYPLFCNVLYRFYEIYRLRLFELFSGYWVIIFVLAFENIIVKIKKKYIKVKKNHIHIKRVSKISKISIVSFIILTSGFFYFINFANIEFGVNFNDNQIQAVSFVGNFFEENPLEDNKGILLEELDSNDIYGLIVEVNLDKKYYNFTADLNYTQFNSEFNILNCEFVFFNISKVNESFIANFSNSFDIIYDGISGYIFGKTR